jgi:hypothetical protein
MFVSFSINIFAVLVGMAINMVLGALWYSPVLFGNYWLKLIGKNSEDISKDDAGKSMSFAIIPAFFSSFSLALLVAFAIPVSILDGVILGTIASVGFSFMSLFNLVLFEDRSIRLTLINSGLNFVAWNIISVVLTLWR